MQRQRTTLSAAQSGPFSTSCLKASFLLGVQLWRSTGPFAVRKASHVVAVVTVHRVAQGLAIQPATLCRHFAVQPFKHHRKRQNPPHHRADEALARLDAIGEENVQ